MKVLLRQGEFSTYKAKISVIVPVHRMAGRLENFKSWFNELTKDFQLIVIHDFGDEETRIELLSILPTNENIEVILVEGDFGGPGAARNAGLPFITSEWVCFWDSDDRVNVSDLLQWVHSVDQEILDLAVFRFSRISNIARSTPKNQKNWNESNESNFITWAMDPGLWRCVIKSGLVKGHHFPNYKIGEDQVFLASLLKLNPRVIFENRDLYEYNIGDARQLTARKLDSNTLYRTALALEKIASDGKLDEKFNLWILSIKMLITGLTRGEFKWKFRFGIHLIRICIFKKNAKKALKSIVFYKITRMENCE